ncbi:MAG TPA: Uma2 family endonuclease [Gemmataceae bacterium]|nr:Uma2 family endonuclease [Gemmataceae bacterium]
MLFPVQGEWTEDEYLALENSGNRLIELVDGAVEVLPMPDLFHQGILQYLFRLLDDFARVTKREEAFLAPLPVRLGEKHMREPDLIFFKPQRIKNRRKLPEGADLVMEIVSPGKENRDRDLKDKRKAYAKAKIPEYWIIDPEGQTITTLTLGAKTYKVHGKYKPGDQASSKLLPGFTINVAEAFAAGLGRDHV